MTHISSLFGNKQFEEPSRNLHSPVSQNSLVHYVLHFHGRLVNCIITGVCFHIIAETCWSRCNGYNIMYSLGMVECFYCKKASSQCGATLLNQSLVWSVILVCQFTLVGDRDCLPSAVYAAGYRGSTNSL